MPCLPKGVQMIVTFMSDFGTVDGYVGAVKGRIKSVFPQADIIDITHSITSFDIKKAAYTLLTYYNQFPKNTVHLCVVDPGVGGDRNGIILESNRFYFVGPDNGLFDLVLKQEAVKAYIITHRAHSSPSATFHGRDIFAHVAALLASGQDAESLGILQSDFSGSERAFFKQKANKYIVEPLTADRFGNIIFGIQKMDILNGRIQRVEFMGNVFERVFDYYTQVEPGEPICLWNSLNYFEIAMNQASAVSKFNPDFKRDRAYITVE